jgi:hypothetical protein
MPSRDTSLRSQLNAAAARLREVDSPELADAVDLVLAPNGWGRLRRSAPEAGGSADTLSPNLPIQMLKATREEIHAAVAEAAAANPGQDISVPTEARKALEAFLDGTFVPDQPKRAARGTGGEKANLNVRVDASLRERAEDFGADHAAEFGWAPRASHVIGAWLVDRFTAAGKTKAAE